LPVLLVSPSKFALENCYVYCPPQHFDEIFAPDSSRRSSQLYWTI